MSAHREPWPSLQRQREADRLGMMVFLASEVMLFGALFGAANILLMLHRVQVEAASARLDLWLGAINTAILLTSSLLVAIGVEARETTPRRTAVAFLGGLLLGVAFLGVKAFEYAQDYHEHLMPGTAIARFANGPERLFIDLYFTATGLHALHVAIGIVLLGGIAWRTRSSKPPTGSAIENVGLYWHLVDAIWVLLYPVLYLMRG